MSTHNLCFEQKYEKYHNFSSESFLFLVVKFSVYLNRHVFVMNYISKGGNILSRFSAACSSKLLIVSICVQGRQFL